MKVKIECTPDQAILMINAVDLLPRLFSIKEQIRRDLKDKNFDLIYESIADIEEILNKLNV
jgi:hypothetical protein